MLIITNAQNYWVERTSKLLLPKLYQLVMQCIPVISARSRFEAQFPGRIHEWKKAAFNSLFHLDGVLDQNSIINLIVIGDSQHEMEAGKTFQKQAKRCLAKLIKLKDSPSALELLNQLKIINK